jgi:hypothetical protein
MQDVRSSPHAQLEQMNEQIIALCWGCSKKTFTFADKLLTRIIAAVASPLIALYGLA